MSRNFFPWKNTATHNILHCRGFRKSDRYQYHYWTWISCTVPIIMAVHSHVIYGRSCLSESSKELICLEVATANGDVSQGSLRRAVIFPLHYIHTTLWSPLKSSCWSCSPVNSYLGLNCCAIICVVCSASGGVLSARSMLKLFEFVPVCLKFKKGSQVTFTF